MAARGPSHVRKGARVLSYIVRRVLGAVPLFLLVSFMCFAIVVSLPGDYLDLLVAPTMSADVLASRRAELGMDRPMPVRYVAWLRGVLSGNFGSSVATTRPVADMIAQRLPATIILMGTALLVSLIIAIPLGVASAIERNGWLDHLSTFVAYLGVSVPTFFSGLGAIYVFSVLLGLLPTGLMETPGRAFDLGDRLRHLVLPVAVLGFQGAAVYTRYMRSSMLEVLRQDYVRTAHAKGLPRRAVYLKHAFRNALVSVVTLLGIAIPGLISGAVITEQVFSWPGIGRLLVDSVNGRDYPVVLGITMMTTVFVVLGNLLADVAYSAIDPRVRYS